MKTIIFTILLSVNAHAQYDANAYMNQQYQQYQQNKQPGQIDFTPTVNLMNQWNGNNQMPTQLQKTQTCYTTQSYNAFTKQIEYTTQCL